MRVAILSPVAWRTPPRHYGPWEQVASNITEGLVEKGIDVTLFATKDSITSGKLDGIIERGYEEDKSAEPKVVECLHIAHLMEQASNFDIIHNHFDFLPLTYSKLIRTPMVTTIHGFSSPKILPVYKKYNRNNYYVSISNADRSHELSYIATVYNGIDKRLFTLNEKPQDYLLYFGRIHHDKGTWEAIQIAKKTKKKLIISGIVQDQAYFGEKVAPWLNDNDIVFVGSSGPEKRDKLLKNAFALLHPINFNEPFGLSVAEAMFCGTPVVAFEKGSMPELIQHGKTGFLVHTIDEAVDALNNIPEINRSYCRRWAEKNFSREKMVEDYIQIYTSILQKQTSYR
ncbi:MAG: glycosyltransferase family 4 protein [Petrimonas sp.]|jgi:glycosyltransferase involved in cell wall biosynthesis|nr:glycosyltransferase family 4 protein [Petrimonas sp.]